LNGNHHTSAANLITLASALVLLLACAVIGLADNPVPPAASPAASTLPTLFIIGDSTVNNHEKGLLGWGDPIKAYFDPAKINVVNRARGGRSSRSYLEEGLWDQVKAQLKPGDFVLMQFGHNDGGPVTDPKGRASLKGIGDETQTVTSTLNGQPDVVHTYGWYMRKYVEDTKAKGATPIVLSPIPRDIWGADGKVLRNNQDYGLWAKQVAQSEHVPFIDLNAIVADKYDKMGFPTVKALYFPGDHTHTSPAGAEVNAAAVVQGIEGLKECPLRDDLLPSAEAQVKSVLESTK
jgi:lysophospholipase L1-like esterase